MRRLTLLVALIAGITVALGVSGAANPSGSARAASGADIPSSGQALPEFAGVDAAVVSMMQRYGIPGAALGLIHDGRLVYSRGYGYSDREAGSLAQPDSRFRIASISKPITAAAVWLLIEQGRLKLNAQVFPLLGLAPPAGKSLDGRINAITVKQLLLHQGGWDRAQSFDPMFRARDAALALGMTPPADCGTIIRWMLGFPLDFDPGTRTAYSNFGYCVLGRVIEKVTGVPYGQFVQQAILNPLGMTGTSLGRTLQQLPGEVRYYDPPGNPLASSVFDGSSVPWPYGGFYLEAMDSHGGWVSTTADLLRFAAAASGSRGSLLHMTTEGSPFQIGAIPYPHTWSFEGALNGTRTILALDNGNGWALLTNTWRFDTNFDQADPLWNDLRTAINSVTAWPADDLFPTTLGPAYGYTLTVTATGGLGSVTSAPAGIRCPSTCAGHYLLGTTLVLTAKAASPLYRFVGWGGPACSGTDPCTIDVDRNTAVTARFAPATARLTVAVHGAGKVVSAPAGISCPRTCSSNYKRATTVTLQATPAKGWRLNRWSDTHCRARPRCTITLNANKLVSTRFVRRS